MFLPGMPLLPPRTGMKATNEDMRGSGRRIACVAGSGSGRMRGPLQLAALFEFDLENLGALRCEGLGNVADVTNETPQAIRLEGGGVVGPLPCAVEGEMPFDPLGAERHGGDVGGDAEVMAREADGLHAGSVGLAQAGDFLQTD